MTIKTKTIQELSNEYATCCYRIKKQNIDDFLIELDKEAQKEYVALSDLQTATLDNPDDFRFFESLPIIRQLIEKRVIPQEKAAVFVIQEYKRKVGVWADTLEKQATRLKNANDAWSEDGDKGDRAIDAIIETEHLMKEVVREMRGSTEQGNGMREGI